jgi:hypothetical protein
VQTNDSPKIEAKMFVSGGGLDDSFNQILSSFKFLIPETSHLWNPICADKKIPDFIIQLKPGEGATHIARAAIESYFNYLNLYNIPNNQNIYLSPEEKIYAEDYIIKTQNLVNNKQTKISISCNTVEQASRIARQLTIQQKQNLEQYSETVNQIQNQQQILQIIDNTTPSGAVKPVMIIGR